ncbi:MAG: hypothetical protein SCK28_07825 [Bacillota bacterium]|nr:hypothetical protein [Bacillota bacterium]
MMQFIYEGMSYHLDTTSVVKDLELIYLKALQGDAYCSLSEEQKFLLEVAWNHFSSKFLKHDYASNGLKGEHMYHMMQVGYVEKIAIDGEKGELTVELTLPVIVN